jgi:uncharacterized protein YjcR
MPRYTDTTRDQAMKLFIRGFTMTEIRMETGVTERQLYNWKEKHDWDKLLPPNTVEIALSRRLICLSDRENKTPEELAELERLIKAFGNMQIDQAKAQKLKAEAYALSKGISPQQLEQIELQGDIVKKHKPRRDKTPKNDISQLTAEDFEKVRTKLFFGYQHEWHARRYDPKTKRNRFILKSRQIGATFYFAFEAFENAVLTGENNLFLSASRDQAEVFKAYIIAFAKDHFDIELKGPSVITLSNGAELRFLSTNSNTAQSYHGHLYIDEVFWIPNYKRLNKVASGMAAHKRWTRTYFSTPSALSHEAYPIWAGEQYNKHKIESEKVEFDISHDNLKNGWLGPDKIWRHMVTVEDAEAQGCNLFDIDELKLEYSEDDYANLFLCRFIDDSKSVFSLASLLACTVDIDAWPDYFEGQTRPFKNLPVALGYDPSRTRDSASLSALAVPIGKVDPWRVLLTRSYHGQNFQYQSNRIKDVKDCHNVVHIGIDTTGIGHGVFELVQDWFPMAQPIHYSLDTKTGLVIKALDVINNNRFKYLAGDHEITRAFLMITQTTTGSGLITYASARSAESGHADVAWSIMHALIYEPLNTNQLGASVTFSD